MVGSNCRGLSAWPVHRGGRPPIRRHWRAPIPGLGPYMPAYGATSSYCSAWRRTVPRSLSRPAPPTGRLSPSWYCVTSFALCLCPVEVPHSDAVIKLGLGRIARSCLSRGWAGPSVRAQNLQITCLSVRGGIVEPIAKQGLLVRRDVHRLRPWGPLVRSPSAD